jgi:UDP-N-acetylmuramate dehydrogenase
MRIEENISLKKMNSFGIDVNARYFISINEEREINKLRDMKIFMDYPRLILGGGSNILFIEDFEGLVIKINIQGIEELRSDRDTVLIKVMAGVNWESFVGYCVGRNLGGLENLTMIPGNTGTSPMQNIGAYGVELKDCFDSLEAMEITTGKTRVFRKDECEFGYRESFFKHSGRDQYIILSVIFSLNHNNHVLSLDYGPVRQELKNMGIKNPGLSDVRLAITNIRSRKIPDPLVLGNAGSFFKNPVIHLNQFNQLIKDFPDIPSFHIDSANVKVPAGWLIEKAGWKGYRQADAGVHKDQALVLVNYGNANGKEILELSEIIKKSVAEKFQINLEREVNVVGG